MASLIKNKILKHLSKFTKNLSPDKLQLSAIQGSCEVTNIELNEEILMQFLELPVWMSLTRAYCNYASIKIQWMKLKTIPIHILLDEVNIDISTCENFRNGSESVTSNQFNQQEYGSYGFTQKVIDGITLSINSVIIQFNSKIFSASFELTRINIESRNFLWKKVDDLSKTRIRDPLRGQVLIFKIVEWQTLRFVAKSEAKTNIGQALRLIANQASCRITLKKRLSDCAVLAARIMFIFDDLLWVLTDSQLLSALHFADYLGDLIKKAPRSKKLEDNDSNNNNNNKNNNNASQQIKMKKNSNNMNQINNVKSPNLLSNSISLLFSKYDIKETSHHVVIRRIEIHLMDDFGPNNDRSQCSELKDGGALQMSFNKLCIDLYPYHRIDERNRDRNHWFHYKDPSRLRFSFITHKLNAFFKKQQTYLKNEGSKFDIESLKSHLFSQVLIIRLNDYSIGHVSTNHRSRKKNDPKLSKLIFFDQSSALPENVPSIYIELNNYFFCEPFDKLNFKIPETNIFTLIAPVKICFDPLTILWMNSFFANLHNALMKLQEVFPMPQNRNQNKPNLRMEICMITIVLSLNEKNEYNLEYDSVEVKISKTILYNCDLFINKEYFKNLNQLLQQFTTDIDFFFEHSNYPWLSCDMKSISPEFIKKINRLFLSDLSTNENVADLDIDFFAVHIEPLWIEIKSSKSLSCFTLLEPLNLTLWINPPNEPQSQINLDLDLNIFVRIDSPVKLQITHDQFIFLIRLFEMIGDFTSNLNYDTYMIQHSQYKRDFENNQTSTLKNTFDLEEKIIKTIFKNTSIVTNIAEINIFLILKQFEDDIVSNENSRCPSTIENLSNECKLSDDLDVNKDEKLELIEENNKDLIKKTMSGYESTTNDPILMPKSLSDLNGENFKQSNEKQSIGFMKKNNFSSSSLANCKIHYAADNEDALSTLSDFSADDSDQQSMIALIGEEDIFDEILTDPGTIEEAVDIVENLNIANENQIDVLNDFSLDNNIKVCPETKNYLIDALLIKIKNVNLIQQSSKGFLSQLFLNCNLSMLEEYKKLPKKEYLDRFKNLKIEVESNENNNLEKQLKLRMDSFNKGSIKDELISIYINNLNQSLNKETIDQLVDFFNDNIAEQVAPLAIIMQNIQFKIIDHSVRVPPMLFNIPKIGLNRNKDNQWFIELNDFLSKDVPITNNLLLQHQKIFEKNLIFDVVDLVKEQDRLKSIKSVNDLSQNDSQEILILILNQKELLLAEIELLRKENESLRKIVELK